MTSPSAATNPRGALTFWLHPCALLLCAQLLEIVVYPATEGTRFAAVVVTALAAGVLLTALRLVHFTRGFVWHALVVAAVAIGLNVAWALTGARWLEAAHFIAAALLYFYAARCLIGYMLADRKIHIDELFAAAATFTLLVWAFAQLLQLCQLLQPQAFAAATMAPRDWSELLFLSFALFTNTGIGDTVPLTAAARAIGDIEMFAGVMYLALVVSRLVGIAVNDRGAKRS